MAHRGFCASCGTPLSFQYDVGPDNIDISVGSLDTPGVVRPAVAIGTESRLPWCDAALFDALPAHETGTLLPPTDLSAIENYQHPDTET